MQKLGEGGGAGLRGWAGGRRGGREEREMDWGTVGNASSPSVQAILSAVPASSVVDPPGSWGVVPHAPMLPSKHSTWGAHVGKPGRC